MFLIFFIFVSFFWVSCLSNFSFFFFLKLSKVRQPWFCKLSIKTTLNFFHTNSIWNRRKKFDKLKIMFFGLSFETRREQNNFNSFFWIQQIFQQISKNDLISWIYFINFDINNLICFINSKTSPTIPFFSSKTSVTAIKWTKLRHWEKPLLFPQRIFHTRFAIYSIFSAHIQIGTLFSSCRWINDKDGKPKN